MIATTTDPDSLANWRANNIYAQVIITMNIGKDQMVHVSRLPTRFGRASSPSTRPETIKLPSLYSTTYSGNVHQMVMISLNT